MAKITQEFRVSALRNGIVVRANKTNPESTPPEITNAAMVEMANLGFIVDVNELRTMSTEALTNMLEDARTIVGADRDMTPIYPGFPEQVEQLDTLTLLVEQILHYWTAGEFLPNYPTIAREGLPLEDMMRNAREVKVLTAANTAREYISALTTRPIALSEDERTLLTNAIELQHPTLETIVEITKNSRNGENLQSFIKAVHTICDFNSNELIIATALTCNNTDQLLRVILTVATAPANEKWNDNYTLTVNTLANRHARAVRMNKISRPARKVIINQLGALTEGFKADSLITRINLWRTIMKAVHPYDFTLTTEQKRAVDIIHTNINYRTLNSLVETAMNTGDATTAIKLLTENQPGNLLRRAVAILRLTANKQEVNTLAEAIRNTGPQSTTTTIISAYNGVISANDDNTRVTRVAGLTNTMVDRKATTKIKTAHLALIAQALKDALQETLKNTPAPQEPVAIISEQPVPLVRRDTATTDRVLDRGQELTPVGKGNTIRIFGHWNNNQDTNGYMDIGAIILDNKFQKLDVCTWNAWHHSREWATYSGDCNVAPGNSAAEYIDVDLNKLRATHPEAKWVAMTVQSWSGWPMKNVDFIAGAMLRSNAKKGDPFDPRTITTAFKPTTPSTQSVPFAINLETGKMIWIDSSNGSTASGISSNDDATVGEIVYDEIERPRLTMGELAQLWAKAHNTKTVQQKVNRDQLLNLLG